MYVYGWNGKGYLPFLVAPWFDILVYGTVFNTCLRFLLMGWRIYAFCMNQRVNLCPKHKYMYTEPLMFKLYWLWLIHSFHKSVSDMCLIKYFQHHDEFQTFFQWYIMQWNEFQWMNFNSVQLSHQISEYTGSIRYNFCRFIP